ncbi:hypothetical protein SAMN06265795_12135 [Noviherbaspirillum humi]|uniref:Uncharacterized protein n=1 Tax=Noviherbaspirillum humi TaxID=1688639 RepID=A0A239LB34_9BURK|nr:hypothetical protein [Noviherbaspirillum humi]SNT27857.1 hypothetical protein SAMN06265795_12135 [Noviherbaspirillum humi]
MSSLTIQSLASQQPLSQRGLPSLGNNSNLRDNPADRSLIAQSTVQRNRTRPTNYGKAKTALDTMGAALKLPSNMWGRDGVNINLSLNESLEIEKHPASVAVYYTDPYHKSSSPVRAISISFQGPPSSDTSPEVFIQKSSGDRYVITVSNGAIVTNTPLRTFVWTLPKEYVPYFNRGEKGSLTLMFKNMKTNQAIPAKDLFEKEAPNLFDTLNNPALKR